MQLALFDMNGVLFLLRWVHFVAGVIWIGLLYYFNFVQGEFFKEISADVKNTAVSKLVPRALFWFRWGAMVTFASGLLIILGTLHTGIALKSSWGIFILIGSVLGAFMWFNVWFVIWPNQKVVIASVNQFLGGGQAIPEAVGCGARALTASRTNVLFSIPMLFFMGSARHLFFNRDFAQISLWPLVMTIGAAIILLEINALKGKPGPLTTVKGVIHSGVILTAVLYLLLEVTTR